jgi:hypothetical protein
VDYLEKSLLKAETQAAPVSIKKQKNLTGV